MDRNKAKGMLWGLVVGDAFGSPIQFSGRDSHPWITEMVACPVFGLPAGYWMDDGSMAMCVMDSFVRKGGYDFGELLNFPLYVNWYTCVGLPNSEKNVDYNYDETITETETGEEEVVETQKRAWSSYLEIGYKHTVPYDITLDGRIGMSPWRSDDTYLNTKFAVASPPRPSAPRWASRAGRGSPAWRPRRSPPW